MMRCFVTPRFHATLDGVLLAAGTFSLTNSIVLGCMFLASAAMMWLLSLRWKLHRRYYQLKEWCYSRELKLIAEDKRRSHLRSELAELAASARIEWLLDGKSAQIVRLSGDDSAYHILAIPIPMQWPLSALRPVNSSRSLIDRFPTLNYPSAFGIDRFTLHGVDPVAARRLSESAARGVLPPDLGIVLIGDRLLIDFSSRPFDEIEMDRGLGLARQISSLMPAPG